MSRVALGLGSNVGDRRRHLEAGVASLASLGRLVGVSPIFESEPVGGPPQDPFLNAVVVVDTDAAPHEVLAAARAAETARGRVRNERWGPRTLDVDVLLYDDLEVRERDLEIPHPRLVGRRFALEPLLLVWPDARLPDGRSLEELLPDVAGQRLRPVTGGWADGRWMASLEEALALDGDGPAYRAVAHPDWQNTLGRLFGGVQAGLALRAAGRARPDLDPAAISWGFLAPVPGGAELDVAVERERDRARAASIRVRLLVGAEVAGSGRVRMAATRPGPALGPPRPAVLSRAACRRLDELLASWGVDGPAIRNWQIRERWDVPSLDPARPDSPFRAWSQAMAVAPDDPALAAAAAVLPIDAFGWPAVHVALGELGDPTLPTTPTVELFAAFHPPPPEGLWQLAEATLTGIAGGRAATGVTVWDPDTGRVVAAGAVTMLLGPGRVPAR